MSNFSDVISVEMCRSFVVLICFLAAVETVWSSADPRGTNRLHGETRNEQDERVHFRGRTKQTSKGQSKDKDNSLNLGNILFDREQLKKYVLDYLWKHHERDPETDTTMNKEEGTFSQTDKIQFGNHHNRLEPSASSTKSKQRRVQNDNRQEHISKKSFHQHQSHTTPKQRTSSSGQTRFHSYQRDHPKHWLSKKFHLPVYYSVKEVNGKENFILDHPLSSDSKSRKRKSKLGGKESRYIDGLTGGKGNKVARTLHNHKAEKRENSLSERSVTNSFPRSPTHRKATVQKNKSHKSGRSHHKGTKLKHHLNDQKEGKNGLRHEKSRKSKKSNKRDFIAILPPKDVKIEGFDVERVHSHSSHEKRKTVGSKIKRVRHLKSKKNLEVTSVAKDVIIRKSSSSVKLSNRKHGRKVAKISHRIDHHDAKVTKRKESHSRKVTKETKKKRIKSHFHKSSKEYKAIRKSFVGPPASKSHPHLKKDKKYHHKREKSIEHNEKTSNGHKRHKTAKSKDSKSMKFSPSWKSLDRRKIPSWYDEAKFGIFVHWGLYSVPSFDNEWFWYNWKSLKKKKYVDFVEKNYPPGFSYNQFAPMFKAEFFDANKWAKLVARSGAR